jgi:hypothetical protein
MIKYRNLDPSLKTYLTLLQAGFEVRSAMGGNVFYVENNAGKDTNDGLSMDSAFKTLSKALVVAEAANGTRNMWAKRTTIFCAGDAIEDVPTAWCEKCDIVGIGQCDGFTNTRLTGAQVLTAITGLRFFNIDFYNTAGVVLTVPTGASAIGLYGCRVLAGATTTTGILATATTDLTIAWTDFLGSWNNNFSTAAISLATGNAPRTIIKFNQIENGGGPGILVNSGRTGAGSFIRDNVIYSSTITIDENSDSFYCLRNYCVSDATAVGTADPVACLDIPGTKSLQNYLVAANVNQQVPTNDTTT